MPRGPRTRTPIPDDPERFAEAIEEFRKRVPMTKDKWRELTEAEREWAFTVSTITQARLVQEIWDSLDRSIEAGTSFEDWKGEVPDQAKQAWGGEEAPRLEAVFRTNVMGAYNRGRDRVFSAPTVRKARPYLMFDAVGGREGDGRTTPICRKLHGTVLPADHPFWKKHRPPLHHLCRSTLVALSQEEAEDMGIAPKPPELDGDEVGEGFGRPSSDEGEDWTPDMTAFADPIRDQLAKRLKR